MLDYCTTIKATNLYTGGIDFIPMISASAIAAIIPCTLEHIKDYAKKKRNETGTLWNNPATVRKTPEGYRPGSLERKELELSETGISNSTSHWEYHEKYFIYSNKSSPIMLPCFFFY